MRQHRAPAPSHGRVGLPRQHRQHRPAGTLAGLVHIHMRIGLVAGDHRAVQAHRVVQVGVHVQRHADGHIGDGAQPAQQLALTVIEALRDHRAMQVQQHRIAAGGHCRADAAGDMLKRGIVHRPAGPGRSGNRHGVVSACGFGQIDKGGYRRAGVPVCRHRRCTLGRLIRASGKARQRRGHR